MSKRAVSRQFGGFAAIGLVCTLLFLLAYHVARRWLPPLAANSLALTSTAGLNFFANRVYTFRVRTGSIAKQAARYFVCYLLGLGASSLALGVFVTLWQHAPRAAELLAALAASGLATVIRYVAMSSWVFRSEAPAAPPPALQLAPEADRAA
jgi:putative flippase GtrA